VAFIDEHVQAGRGVYIHCAAGLGRAPTQAAAYLMWRGLSLAESVTAVQARRPFIHLSAAQRRSLDQFAAHLATRPNSG
jgi:protein-tyrosine phosphatase